MTPRFCVVIPVYNHAQTVGRVVVGARSHFPVIVVDDGSTDGTPAVLAAVEGIQCVSLPFNQGKGAALKAGFEAADRAGFTHAITLDADGQHSVDEIPALAEASRREPGALVVGVRDLVKEGAPRGRRITNHLSTFWFRVETGVALGDTQCGFRCYPLAVINGLRVRTGRYAYELEVMVKAAWAGVPLVAQPVSADYAAPTSRLSHFHPRRDLISVSLLHARLSIQSFCVPALLRRYSANGQLRQMRRRERVRTVLRELFTEHTDSPARLSFAVGLGFFCGIAPIWGFQIIAAAALAHRLRLNKAIAVTASHISFPLAAPFIMAGGLLLGHYLLSGTLLPLNRESLLQEIPVRIGEWFFGSLVLGVFVGLLGVVLTWSACRFLGGPGRSAA